MDLGFIAFRRIFVENLIQKVPKIDETQIRCHLAIPQVTPGRLKKADRYKLNRLS